MYQCKTPQIEDRKDKRVLSRARDIIKSWRDKSRGSRPYVRMNTKGLRGKVFIDDFHYHIDLKSPEDRVNRYRLIPCVFELLRKTEDEPEKTPQGNLMFEGLTPDGVKFRVIVRPEKDGGCLQSFHPFK